ncbi:MAG: hypothetical protein U1E60_00955 [Reyranellaceae bacterium]
MTSLHDLSIDAADSERGLGIFRREGVVVVKGLLPRTVVQSTAHFLQDELVRLDCLFRRYGVSMKDATAPARLAELVEQPGERVPDKHIFLGHYPL